MFSSIHNWFLNWLTYSWNSIKPEEAQILQQLHLNLYWILHRGDNSIHKWINTKPLQTAASKHQQREIILPANWKHKFLFVYCDNINRLIQKIKYCVTKPLCKWSQMQEPGRKRLQKKYIITAQAKIAHFCIDLSGTLAVKQNCRYQR